MKNVLLNYLNMDDSTLDTIRSAYGWKELKLVTVNSGLINTTWKAEVGEKDYLLQVVNTQVFKHPEQIDENLRMLASHLAEKAPGYLFTAPVKTSDDQSLLYINEKYYRVFEWIPGSHTLTVVANSDQAYEAARQFGMFTALLKDFDSRKLHITLPDFHNLGLRYQQFEKALQDGDAARISEAKDLIQYLRSKSTIVDRFETFCKHPDAKKRVTHHDTKISNVLFDERGRGLCVIDLDTVMPGYFLSDVGDMLRTYVCPVSEEEKDLSLISIRKNIMRDIEHGYLLAMGAELSIFEKDHLYFGGEMLIYMQALRFLTDHLNRDVYYGSKYPGHNLVRAQNQAALLEQFQQAL
jgi:Ser/Thr protein kinase RdoA (MazF antagonist)